MQLKTVTVIFDYVIAVRSDEDPYRKAKDHVADALDDLDLSDITIGIRQYAEGDCHNWDGDCIPYGGDGTTKTKDYA